MKIIDQKYVQNNKKEIIEAILNGKIFIYPTDTIYGIGCNAKIDESVKKIRIIKGRDEKPMSVAVPNLNWVRDNCIINENTENNLKKLPGPFTFFLCVNRANCVSSLVNPMNDGTLGIRMFDHWFSEIIEEAGVPFITTSVNTSGYPFMTDINDLEENIKNSVDLIIYEGGIKGNPSTKIDLTL